MASAAFPDGPEDTKAQIPVDQPSGNNLVIADTQGTILRYVEDIILDGCEEKLEVIVLPSACRREAYPMLLQLPDDIIYPGIKLLGAVF